jgi:hypothetical protein
MQNKYFWLLWLWAYFYQDSIIFRFFYTILKGVWELHNSLLFSILTHYIQVFLRSSLIQFSSFFGVLQEAYRHDNLMGDSTCFQSALKSCVILAVLQQWHPVLSSFQRCVTWSDWAADHTLGKQAYGRAGEWRVIRPNYQHTSCTHHWAFWSHKCHMVRV